MIGGLIAVPAVLFLMVGFTALYFFPPVQSVPTNLGALAMAITGIGVMRGVRWSTPKAVVALAAYWIAYEVLWHLIFERLLASVEYWVAPVEPWSVYAGTAFVLLALATLLRLNTLYRPGRDRNELRNPLQTGQRP